jgi:arylsulfatase
MATCVDVAGANYPAEFAGQKIHPPEGVSLRAAMNGRPPAADRPLFWEHEGNRAVRVGAWKLVAKFPGGWELYDLAADRAEQRDLAAQHPARVREMAAQYDGWAKRVGVLPWPIGSAIKAEAAAKKAAATPK